MRASARYPGDPWFENLVEDLKQVSPEFFRSGPTTMYVARWTATKSSSRHMCEKSSFGDIVFAQVDGIWWGYFFATKAGVGSMTIKRIPLTGGAAATVLATVTDVDVANSHRNLVTDGVNLYWQDDVSVRKMPIRGDDITVLDTTSPNTPTAGLALQNGNLIYASVADIHYVPTSGGAVTSPFVRTITDPLSC